MQSYQDMADQLAKLIERQLHIAHDDLSVLARRVGRRVPRRVRRELRQVASAAQMGRHPKMARRIDDASVQAAFAHAKVWLENLDWDAKQAQARRAMLAELAFNLMLAAFVIVALLAWLGVIGLAPDVDMGLAPHVQCGAD